MTDELIAKLSKIQSLRVISRNSVFMFKNTPKSTKDIAQQLQVRNILDGSVRKAGDRFRINVQLIDAETDAPVWSETYEKNLDDIFVVQDTVAQAIVGALRLSIMPEEKIRISERPIDNISAYQCYLRARQAIYSYSLADLDQAYKEVQDALKAAGDNVLLYSTLGVIYYQYVNKAIEREENLKKAQETVAKIFLLDPDSPYGQRLLGLIQLRLGKAREAPGHLQKAIASDPNDFDALYWLTYIYSQAGKIPAARQICLRLSQINPLFSSPDQKFYVEIMDGQFDRALEIFRSTDFSSNQHLRFWEIWILAFAGRTDEALKLMDLYNSDFTEVSNRSAMLFFLRYALQGQKTKALASVTNEVINYCQYDEQWSWMMADGYGLIGEREEAVRWLEIAVNRGFVNYPFISKYDPFLKNIRGEERFKKLMERAKYEWEHFEE
jgi:eukaryotic-like serine/threonine-protein kinase